MPNDQNPEADVRVSNHSSIWTFYTDTPEAREWVAENVEVDMHMTLGDTGFHCQHSAGTDIVLAMREAGFIVIAA